MTLLGFEGYRSCYRTEHPYIAQYILRVPRAAQRLGLNGLGFRGSGLRVKGLHVTDSMALHRSGLGFGAYAIARPVWMVS